MEWPDILNDYEAHLDKVEAAIAGKGPWPGEYAQPNPKVMMPQALETRARALVKRTGELGAIIRERMSICEAVLSQSKSRDASGRVVLVDVRA